MVKELKSLLIMNDVVEPIGYQKSFGKNAKFKRRKNSEKFSKKIILSIYAKIKMS